MGVDPGLSTTGYAVVQRSSGPPRAVAFGAVQTAPPAGTAARLAELAGALEILMAEHSPDVVAIERLFFNANVRTAMSVGQASGVALATAARLGLGVADYTPTEVKQSVVGVGGATKAQVKTMVAHLLGLERAPSPADAADACALALCHLGRARLHAAIGRAAP
jgi:crossover junction endodeoxyribonuclease RuvC